MTGFAAFAANENPRNGVQELLGEAKEHLCGE